MEKKRLTIHSLRTFKGYENVTDEEAEYAIAAMEKTAMIFFELFQKKKMDMEKFVGINSTNEINIEINNYEKRNAA